LAKAAGRSEDYLFYIRRSKCPTCLRRERPGPVPNVGLRPKAQEFNVLVGVDLKECLDVDGTRHTYLNVLDVATRYSVFLLVPTKSSDVVAQTFMDGWVAWAGIPQQIVHDQGGEFFKHFAEMLRKLGIEPHITSTESPWQNGLVERHGQVLAEVVSVMVDQCQLKGPADMHLAGIFAATAKNRRPDRTGHSARTRVFGTAERFPGSVVDARLEGENAVEMERCLHDPVMRRSSRLRTEASCALERLGADRRWSAAISSGVARSLKS
jgi:hypothetical protein